MSAADIEAFLNRSGWGESAQGRQLTPLTGGVSSDIWRVDMTDRPTVCVKRALAKLKVAADWHAPVSRNAVEWAWIQFARHVAPHAVPKPLAHDATAGMFAMEFLDPVDHPVWKQQLLAGNVNVETARAVGRVVGILHQASAQRADLAATFDTLDNFQALRLEPYLVATAKRHPDLATQLHRLVQRTAQQSTVVVHGDISPKNILVGPRGPVILDAECAWYGDPAFDVAFCLNHLMLKRVVSRHADALHAAFEAWVNAYFDVVAFEPRGALEARCAELLPALMLARVDGKSPVEYLSQEDDRERVRSFARERILQPRDALLPLSLEWMVALNA